MHYKKTRCRRSCLKLPKSLKKMCITFIQVKTILSFCFEIFIKCCCAVILNTIHCHALNKNLIWGNRLFYIYGSSSQCLFTENLLKKLYEKFTLLWKCCSNICTYIYCRHCWFAAMKNLLCYENAVQIFAHTYIAGIVGLQLWKIYFAMKMLFKCLHIHILQALLVCNFVIENYLSSNLLVQIDILWILHIYRMFVQVLKATNNYITAKC